MVSKGDKTIASILTLTYKRTLVYKYGCSDARFHNLGGMPWVFWKVIQNAKRVGLQEFDFGRSEISDDGLVSFKEHLGATRSKMTYLSYPAPRSQDERGGLKVRFF